MVKLMGFFSKFNEYKENIHLYYDINNYALSIYCYSPQYKIVMEYVMIIGTC